MSRSLILLAAALATPDALLTSNTKLSLWTTAGVSSAAVHVDTNDGVVTLYGKVPSTEAKALAENTAQHVSGVHSVMNLLKVVPAAQQKPAELADSTLLAAARTQLAVDPKLRDTKISVKSVDQGVVLLSGDARGVSEHLLAIHDVYRLKGVRRVATEVNGLTGLGKEDDLGASDTALTLAVKLRLLTAAEIPSTPLNVDTQDGVVTLFGIVPSAGVKTAAATAARKVPGVKSVDNLLEIVPSSQRKLTDAKDVDIRRDLTLAFAGQLDLKGVALQVKNGTVRLTGSVGSAWDELNAVRLARGVVGVHRVEDSLKRDDGAGDGLRQY